MLRLVLVPTFTFVLCALYAVNPFPHWAQISVDAGNASTSFVGKKRLEEINLAGFMLGFSTVCYRPASSPSNELPSMLGNVTLSTLGNVSPSTLGNVSPSMLGNVSPSMLGNVSPSMLGNVSPLPPNVSCLRSREIAHGHGVFALHAGHVSLRFTSNVKLRSTLRYYFDGVEMRSPCDSLRGSSVGSLPYLFDLTQRS
ncbi:hypothetical protein VNI00_011837 [Paramarasmius palmivorus]|uniref:Uncharacterized protein n=1 Tax=Paramarasmius palmivorus TaxID=297713 RepID=A0AAW0C8Z2_9AGAR